MTASFMIFTKQPIADGFLPIHLAASNGDFAGSTETSIYLDEFKFFADQLKTFPRTPGDKVLFSSGGDDDAWQSYLYLEAYALEGQGQSAVQVRLRRNEPEMQAGGSVFTITTQHTAINHLGQVLSAWLDGDADRLEVQI
jgi:hypothetical protein